MYVQRKASYFVYRCLICWKRGKLFEEVVVGGGCRKRMWAGIAFIVEIIYIAQNLLLKPCGFISSWDVNIGGQCSPEIEFLLMVFQ